MVASVIPQAREDGLVIEGVEDELLVYDLERHKAHCLSSTAALVWLLCDGKTTVSDISARLQRKLQAPVDDYVVWVALRRLGKANLLCERVTPPEELFRSSRRELMRKVAMIGGGLSVITILAPTAQAGLSAVQKVNVSCNHLCISNHNITTLPCPGGITDQEDQNCCSTNPRTQCTNPGPSHICTGPC